MPLSGSYFSPARVLFTGCSSLQSVYRSSTRIYIPYMIYHSLAGSSLLPVCHLMVNILRILGLITLHSSGLDIRRLCIKLSLSVQQSREKFGPNIQFWTSSFCLVHVILALSASLWTNLPPSVWVFQLCASHVIFPEDIFLLLSII